jgi:uncharacterized protein (DUF1501 family)
MTDLISRRDLIRSGAAATAATVLPATAAPAAPERTLEVD